MCHYGKGKGYVQWVDKLCLSAWNVYRVDAEAKADYF